MKKINYIIIALIFVFYPFYFFDSGKPQISDILILLSFIIFIFNYKIKNDLILKIILIILFLVFFINLFWAFFLSSSSFIISSFYYLLNFMFLIMILNMYFTDGDRLLNLTYKSIIISITIQVFLSPLFINTNLSRQTLMFNNPNQLGYYSLLGLAVIILIYFMSKKNNIQFIFTIIATFYLAFLSNSTATIISMVLMITGVLLFLIIVKFSLKQKLVTMVVFLIAIPLFIINLNTLQNITLVENFLNRIDQKETKNISVAEERHYDRVLDYFELTILGAGEGLTNERFNSPVEIHSTVLSFYFNYGLITTILLAVLFYLLVLKNTSYIPIVVLIGIHFYGFTHNGIRQPLFWLAHGFIYIGIYKNLFYRFNFKKR